MQKHAQDIQETLQVSLSQGRIQGMGGVTWAIDFLNFYLIDIQGLISDEFHAPQIIATTLSPP